MLCDTRDCPTPDIQSGRRYETCAVWKHKTVLPDTVTEKLGAKGQPVALTFGQHADVVYEHAPLTSVICQIKFSPILSLTSEVGVAGFQEAIRREYPDLKPESSTNVAMGPRSVGVQQQPPVWRFRTSDQNWAVGVAVDFVSLEVAQYSDFTEFLSRMMFVIAALELTLHPSPSTRIGLRKVNELQHPDVKHPSDWARQLRPELLGLLAAVGMPAPIDFALSDIRFTDDTNLLAVRHGLHPERTNTYLLDLDYFTDRPFEIADGEDLPALLRYFSNGMTSFFHWALAPELLNTFGPKPREKPGVI